MFWIEIASSKFKNQNNVEKTKIVVIGCGVSYLTAALSSYFSTRQLSYTFMIGLLYIAITSFGFFKGAKMLSVRISEGLREQNNNVVYPEPENGACTLNVLKETQGFYCGQSTVQIELLDRMGSRIQLIQTDKFGDEKKECGRSLICRSESFSSQISVPIVSSTLQRQSSAPLTPRFQQFVVRKRSVPLPHRFQKIPEQGRSPKWFDPSKNKIHIQSASVKLKLQTEQNQVPPNQKNCEQFQPFKFMKNSQKDEKIIASARMVSLWLATLFLSSTGFVVTLNYPCTGALTCICAFCMIFSVLLMHLRAIIYLTPRLQLSVQSIHGFLPLKVFVSG